MRVAMVALRVLGGMAVAAELRGADVPSWLGPRVDRVRVQIHEQLAQYAR